MNLSVVPGAPPVTLEGLLKHVQKYGMDIDYKATRRVPNPRHTSWKGVMKEAVVEVAIAGLGPNAFVLFIEGIGYGHFRDQALAAWNETRGIDPDAAEEGDDS